MGALAQRTRRAQVRKAAPVQHVRSSRQRQRDEAPVGLVRPPPACATSRGWRPSLPSSGHYRRGSAWPTWHSHGSVPSASPLVSCDFAPPVCWHSPPTHCQWDSLGPESWHTGSCVAAAADSAGSCPTFPPLRDVLSAASGCAIVLVPPAPARHRPSSTHAFASFRHCSKRFCWRLAASCPLSTWSSSGSGRCSWAACPPWLTYSMTWAKSRMRTASGR